jgi:hypothetical protein
MSKELLVNKLAQNLSDSELLELAMARLSDADIAELEKGAALVPPRADDVVKTVKRTDSVGDILGRILGGAKEGVTSGGSGLLQGAKNLGKAGLSGIEHLVSPTHGTYTDMGLTSPLGIAAASGQAAPGVLSRAGHAIGNMGSTIAANPGTSALAAAPLVYLLAKKMGLIGKDEQEGSHGDMSGSYGDMSMGGSAGDVSKMASAMDAELTKLANDPSVALAMLVLARNGLL